MKTLISVDPGQSGGIAWINYKFDCVDSIKMPETEGDILDRLQNIVAESVSTIAYVELVPIGMPGKGAAMAKLNANAAFIRGCFMALHVRMILVRPAEWQQYYNLGTRSACKDDTTWKNKLKAEAQRRFPDQTVTLKTADALLILDYARNQHLTQKETA